jgi:hypothetical protein
VSRVQHCKRLYGCYIWVGLAPYVILRCRSTVMATQYSPAQLLSKNLMSAYTQLLPGDQRHAADALEAFINQLRNGPDELRKALGVPWGDDPVQNETNTRLLLDTAYWQISQFFRVGHHRLVLLVSCLTSGFCLVLQTHSDR